MALTKRKIGNLIQEFTKRNSNRDDIPFTGINIDKEFMPSHADTNEIDSSKYKIVSKNDFVFSGMQTGRDNCIRIGMYDKDDLIQVSPAYQTFKVTSKDILPHFLFMYFKSKEKDRYGAFLSDGSIRSNLDWDAFCDIELDLPPVEIQRKYVAIYEGLLANLHSYENKLEELKLVCDGYIDQLKKTNYLTSLEPYIIEYSIKNDDLRYKVERGISTKKELIIPKSTAEDIRTQKVFLKGTFCFATNTARNADKLSIALNKEGDCIVSPTYCTFRCSEKLINEYLNIYVQRSEFDRYVRFNSWGSVREMFVFGDLKNVKIPVPPIEIQNSIVEVFNVYNERKEFVNRLKNIIKDICPLLVRGAIKEASEVK